MPHPANYAMTATTQAASAVASSLPPIPEANSTVLLWKYLGTVGSWTLLVIAALSWMYWQLKKNPTFLNRLKGMVGASVLDVNQAESKSLVVEETIQLDADKLLHLVRCEGEKFLMSNGPDGLKLLTKVSSWQEALQHLHPEEIHHQTTPMGSVTERTQAMVDAHGDVHLTNTPQPVGMATTKGVSFPAGIPKTILGQTVPWFTNR